MGSVVIPELNCGSGSSRRMMPVLGMGTAAFPFDGSSSSELKVAILSAIKLGYRHFDTAAFYNSEQSLGEAISEAIQLGLIKSRDELFITSKLWCTDAHKDLVLPALQNTLRNLKLESLDLYLIHFPISIEPRKSDLLITEEDQLVPMDFKSVWTAMEECQRLGLTKSIGVSNFSCKKLENLLDIANIPPAVNQVEINPLWQQKKLKEFCIAKGIVMTAYSTFGSKGTVWGSNRVMECEVLNAIAKAKGKSIAQVCLRWVYEQGMSMVVKSFNEERLKENLKIFDWELNAEELEMINEIPQSRGILHDHFLSPNGPFKSHEEFWDGEI